MKKSHLIEYHPSNGSIRLIRILGIVMAAIVPPFRYMLPPEAIDPIWIRIALSVLALGIVISSYVSAKIRAHAQPVAYILCFVITTWMLVLAAANHLAQEYVTSYCIMLFSSIILFRSKTWLIAFICYSFCLTIITQFFITAPTFNPYTFAGMIMSILILGFIGQWIGVLEFQDSVKRGKRLHTLNQTALASSNEGIIVTDQFGHIQRSNAVFQKFFGLHIEGESVVAMEEWLQAVQKEVLEPMLVVGWANAVTQETDREFSEQFQLRSGQYVRVFSKPIKEGENNHGRIWFFKDVTSAQRQKAMMEEQQNRLRRQNAMLLALSTNEAMQIGELDMIAPIIARESAQSLSAIRSVVWEMQSDHQTLAVLTAFHNTSATLPPLGKLTATSNAPLWDAIQAQRVLSIMQGDPAGAAPAITLGTEKSHSMLVPLRLNGEVFGAISIDRALDQAEWSLDEQQFLAAIGDLLSTAIAAGKRRSAEKDLANSAALLQAVFELAGVGILVTRTNRTVIDCNDTYLSIFGLDRDFVLHGDPDSVMAKSQELVQDIHLVHARIKFLADNPDENRYEPLFFKDGRILETFTEVLRVDGQIIGRVWFYRDVTERMNAEQRLRASEFRNKAIIDAIPDLMLRISMGCGILDIKIPERWSQSELIRNPLAKTVKDLFLDELAQAIMAMAAHVFAEQELAVQEQAIELEGIVRDVETRIAPSGQGEVLIMLRDVTDRKKTERELLQRNHELDSFVYRASHDLKAPLNSLMGLIDIIKLESQDHQLGRYLSLMDKSVVKLDTFIRNLTDFSRINRSAISFEAVDFDRIIAEAEEGLHYMQNANQVLRNIVIDAPVPFWGDNFHLSIVLSNLISNALKYYDIKKPQPKVDILVTCTALDCKIVVADNGVGIPKIHQGRIFELFYRATNQSFGSGLGLYITRNAVEKMGGTIEMASEEAIGTTFTIVLPNQFRSDV